MTEPARLDRKGAGMKQKAKEGGKGDTLKVIVQALLIALVVRTFLFQPFNIPSGSMIPTLLIGDYLFVSKYAYGYSQSLASIQPRFVFRQDSCASPPKRGDVAVFKLPRDGQTDYIKRVIGLPGDKIQMKEGRLYINGEIVPREADCQGPYRGFLRARNRRPDLSRDTARRSQPHDHPNSGRHRVQWQYPGFRSSGRKLFHDGRQPGQFDGQPSSARSGRRRLRAV